MPSKYTLTLSTTGASRLATPSTTWTLTNSSEAGLVARGGTANDPHGDHARVEGRAAARKHAAGLGHAIRDRDVQVVYGERPPAVCL